MKSFPEQSMDIIETIQFSFSVWRAAIAKLWLLSLIVNIIIVLPYFFHPNGYYHQIVTKLADYQFSSYWLIFFAQFIAVAILYGAMYSQIISTMAHQEQSIKAALLNGLKRSPSVIIASFMFIILVMFGFALLVFPGIYLFIALYFYMPIIMLEEVGPIRAIIHGAYLVTPNWWRSLIIILLTAAVSFSLTLLCLWLTRHMTISHPSNITHSVGAVAGIGIIGFFVTPWLFCLYMTHVFDLENRNMQAHKEQYSM